MRANKQSQFIISLDFELMWGVRDKRTIATYGENIRGVREAIPGLLDIFDRFQVSATFATVGFLFARTKKELQQYMPTDRPQYSQKKYSPYESNYLLQIGENEAEDIYHFAGSLIQEIQQSEKHEIGSHTFSHFYCLEQASLSSFREDLLAAKKIATTYGIDLKSIIFPRNQYSNAHLEVCKELGFLSFRGNEQSSVYQPRKNEDIDLPVRITRLADSYLNLTGHHCSQPTMEQGLVNLPASRFLRPYSAKHRAFEPLRLHRIQKSMSYAAKNNLTYHLWWHPHNFGRHLAENLKFLEEILTHYSFLHQTQGMRSQTMESLATEILQANAVA